MVGQTKFESLVESATNIGVGYIVSLMVQILVFPLFDLQVTLTENVVICLIFTAASLVRMYFLRRFFNWSKLNGNIRSDRVEHERVAVVGAGVGRAGFFGKDSHHNYPDKD